MQQIPNILDFRTKEDEEGNIIQDFSSNIDTPKIIDATHFEIIDKVAYEKGKVHIPVYFERKSKDGTVLSNETRIFIFDIGDKPDHNWIDCEEKINELFENKDYHL